MSDDKALARQGDLALASQGPFGHLRALMHLGNDMLGRMHFGEKIGSTFDGARNVYKACGYKGKLEPWDYRFRYMRNGVAKRIVEAFPDATWRAGGEVVESEDAHDKTPFEEAWKLLEDRFHLWHLFRRVDVIAGIGRFGILLIGAPGEMEEPLPERLKMEDITYLLPFYEEDATVQVFNQDFNTARFSQPEMYMIRRIAKRQRTGAAEPQIGRSAHWTRVIHVAEGLLDDPVYGVPRLRPVWNLLDDLEKIHAGGSEAYWKRADGGTLFSVDRQQELEPEDVREFKKDLQLMTDGLQKNLLLRGITAERLGSDVADIGNPVDAIVGLISASTGIPQRLLQGSEMGELASSQDRDNWNDRVSDRRTLFAEPLVVRPFVDRMIACGVLPEPKSYNVRWPEIRNFDPIQRANVAATLARAIVGSQPVITADEIRDLYLDLDPLKPSQKLPAVPQPTRQPRSGPPSYPKAGNQDPTQQNSATGDTQPNAVGRRASGGRARQLRVVAR